MKAELAQEPVHGERVRIYVNRDIDFNREKLEKITRSVLGKLGCDGCHSGRILEIIQMRDFVVNPKTLEPEEVVGAGRIGG